jgi:hypothetical protein
MPTRQLWHAATLTTFVLTLATLRRNARPGGVQKTLLTKMGGGQDILLDARSQALKIKLRIKNYNTNLQPGNLQHRIYNVSCFHLRAGVFVITMKQQDSLQYYETARFIAVLVHRGNPRDRR